MLHLQTQLLIQGVVEPTKELERLLDSLTNEAMPKVMISSKGIFYKQSATSLGHLHRNQQGLDETE